MKKFFLEKKGYVVIDDLITKSNFSSGTIILGGTTKRVQKNDEVFNLEAIFKKELEEKIKNKLKELLLS